MGQFLRGPLQARAVLAKPDENLVSYLDRSLITSGRALDVGCGPGRNTLHLASAGFTVDAVDPAEAAIAWALDLLHLTEVEMRRMHDESPESPCFGEPFLWAALFRHYARL